jgi:predicted RNase H-like HicB family nuclease
MQFPVAIETDDSVSAFGIVVPDLPGCFSAGDSLEEAMANIVDAIEHHCAALEDDGQSVPAPRLVGAWLNRKEFEGWTWTTVEVPL